MNPINSVIVTFVKILPKQVVHIFAKKYIAGEKLEDAVNVVKEFNSRGIAATMDVLGEAISNKKEAEQAKIECLQVLDEIYKNKLDSNLSLKPTQLGLGIDKDFCYEQISEILERAKQYNNFVRIDMEDSPFTEITFDLYKRLHEKYDNLGVVIQSYLRRVMGDIKSTGMKGANYRLCKGIYIEPVEIAYKGYQEVRENYLKLLSYMLDNGNYVGIATHDDYLVEKAIEMIKQKNIPRDKFEFQMLYGVKERLREKLASSGYKLRIYVPYGEHWYKYSIRRLQENPNMAWHITKSIFSF